MHAEREYRIAPSDTTGRRKGGRLSAVFSPLTRRILAVNLVAPVLLALGLLFLDEYEDSLIATELEALRTEAELIAGSIGEGAVTIDNDSAQMGAFTPTGSMRVIDPPSARQLIRRLASVANVRVRLFDRTGNMVADSRLLRGPGGEVRLVDLPAAENDSWAARMQTAYSWVETLLGMDNGLEPYRERGDGTAYDYPETATALERGEAGEAVRRAPTGRKMLTVAVPVQFYKQIVGALLVSEDDANIETRLFEVRGSILEILIWTFVATILLSLYFAGTIARPVRRLAQAANRVREGHSRQHAIPDLGKRGDEIGDLSSALRDMTEGLWRRMDATEQFAADVAHEIKNPLTSLRSAVETVVRVSDPEQQKRLMGIIKDDVDRLDRLISDISDASRLDAELSRQEMEKVSLRILLSTLADVSNSTDKEGAPRVIFECDPADNLIVQGLEDRLAQVFRNLIGNAASFSPPQGKITVLAARGFGIIQVDVEDEGPGLPPGKEQEIFSRFYSERPEKEKFGTHSGLGLSISKQIVEAHRGTISAETRAEGGARFTVRFPAI